MNTKVISAAVVGLLSVGAFAFGMTQVYAYRGDYTQTGPNHTEEREADMEKVMSNKDFATWKKLMTEDGRSPGVLTKIDTQAEFDKFAEAYKLAKAGKVTEANAIRTELRLGNGSGRGERSAGRGNGKGTGGSFVDQNKNGVCDRME
jgi:hypothetical protein